MTDYGRIARWARESEFKDHKATIILDNKEFLVLDWRNVNGSSTYFVRYIVDKLRGALIIQGDIGSAIATWHNQLEPIDLAGYVKNYSYFLSKFNCSSVWYTYKDEDIEHDVKELQREFYDNAFDEEQISLDEYIEELPEEEKEFWENLADNISNCRWGPGYYTDELSDELYKFLGSDWVCNSLVADAGRRIAPAVIMWAEGFAMAYKDAFENKEEAMP